MPEKCSAPDKRHQVDVIVLGRRDDKVARYRLLVAAPISPSIRERCDVAVNASGAKAIETALGEVANTLYAKFGAALDLLMHPSAWLGEPTALTGKSFTQVLLGSFSPSAATTPMSRLSMA